MQKEEKKTLIIKILIFLILLIILIITSFKKGEKFYILKNTYFNTTKSQTNSTIARWYFDARIK